MAPHSEAVTEVAMVAGRAELALAKLGPQPRHSDLEDHRTAVLGELLDAFDRAEPGLGTRLMLAMYPNANGVRP